MIAQATRCYDCGSYISRDIYFGRFGKRNNVPLWVCPNCGVVHEDYRWFKYVSQQEANAIIEHRGPRGLFVLETGADRVKIRFTKNAISSVEKLNMDNAPKK